MDKENGLIIGEVHRDSPTTRTSKDGNKDSLLMRTPRSPLSPFNRSVDSRSVVLEKTSQRKKPLPSVPLASTPKVAASREKQCAESSDDDLPSIENDSDVTPHTPSADYDAFVSGIDSSRLSPSAVSVPSPAKHASDSALDMRDVMASFGIEADSTQLLAMFDGTDVRPLVPFHQYVVETRKMHRPITSSFDRSSMSSAESFSDDSALPFDVQTSPAEQRSKELAQAFLVYDPQSSGIVSRAVVRDVFLSFGVSVTLDDLNHLAQLYGEGTETISWKNVLSMMTTSDDADASSFNSSCSSRMAATPMYTPKRAGRLSESLVQNLRSVFLAMCEEASKSGKVDIDNLCSLLDVNDIPIPHAATLIDRLSFINDGTVSLEKKWMNFSTLIEEALPSQHSSFLSSFNTPMSGAIVHAPSTVKSFGAREAELTEVLRSELTGAHSMIADLDQKLKHSELLRFESQNTVESISAQLQQSQEAYAILETMNKQLQVSLDQSLLELNAVKENASVSQVSSLEDTIQSLEADLAAKNAKVSLLESNCAALDTQLQQMSLALQSSVAQFDHLTCELTLSMKEVEQLKGLLEIKEAEIVDLQQLLDTSAVSSKDLMYRYSEIEAAWENESKSSQERLATCEQEKAVLLNSVSTLEASLKASEEQSVILTSEITVLADELKSGKQQRKSMKVAAENDLAVVREQLISSQHALASSQKEIAVFEQKLHEQIQVSSLLQLTIDEREAALSILQQELEQSLSVQQHLRQSSVEISEGMLQIRQQIESQKQQLLLDLEAARVKFSEESIRSDLLDQQRKVVIQEHAELQESFNFLQGKFGIQSQEYAKQVQADENEIAGLRVIITGFEAELNESKASLASSLNIIGELNTNLAESNATVSTLGATRDQLCHQIDTLTEAQFTLFERVATSAAESQASQVKIAALSDCVVELSGELEIARNDLALASYIRQSLLSKLGSMTEFHTSMVYELEERQQLQAEQIEATHQISISYLHSTIEQMKETLSLMEAERTNETLARKDTELRLSCSEEELNTQIRVILEKNKSLMVTEQMLIAENKFLQGQIAANIAAIAECEGRLHCALAESAQLTTRLEQSQLQLEAECSKGCSLESALADIQVSFSLTTTESASLAVQLQVAQDECNAAKFSAESANVELRACQGTVLHLEQALVQALSRPAMNDNMTQHDAVPLVDSATETASVDLCDCAVQTLSVTHIHSGSNTYPTESAVASCNTVSVTTSEFACNTPSILTVDSACDAPSVATTESASNTSVQVVDVEVSTTAVAMMSTLCGPAETYTSHASCETERTTMVDSQSETVLLSFSDAQCEVLPAVSESGCDAEPLSTAQLDQAERAIEALSICLGTMSAQDAQKMELMQSLEFEKRELGDRAGEMEQYMFTELQANRRLYSQVECQTRQLSRQHDRLTALTNLAGKLAEDNDTLRQQLNSVYEQDYAREQKRLATIRKHKTLPLHLVL